MATSSRPFQISVGTPTTLSDTTTIIGSQTQGTPNALRVLTHPDAANFPAISYYRNPDEDYNIDNDVLFAPITTVTLTQGSTRLTRHTRALEDVIVTEVWTTRLGLSMPVATARLMYEYFVNPPAFSSDPLLQTYITWQPRDKNDFTYNVEIVDMQVGGGEENRQFKMSTVNDPGGANPLTADVLREPVTWIMRIVSKVT